MLKQGTLHLEGVKAQEDWHSDGLNYSDGHSSGQSPHLLHSGYNITV